MTAPGHQPRARVTFLGDTLIGGEAQPVLDRRGAEWAFDGIRHLLADSDLVVANQEGPITRIGAPHAKLDNGRKRYWYRAQPASTQALVDAGVRVVSLGNNHVLDFGEEGLAETIETLDEHGIAHCGAGQDRAAARRPAIIKVNGLRFGFLSFMQRYDIYVAENAYASRHRAGPLRLNIARAKADFGRLAEQVDVRVALAHWGRNYRRINPRQRRLAVHLTAAGADLIVGHHPHIPQRIRLVDGVPVCFSLGNGPLGTPGRFHSGRPPYGLIVTVDFDQLATPTRMAVTLIETNNSHVNFQPQVAPAYVAEPILAGLLPSALTWHATGRGAMVADLPRRTAKSTPGDRSHDQKRSTAEDTAASQRERPASPSST